MSSQRLQLHLPKSELVIPSPLPHYSQSRFSFCGYFRKVVSPFTQFVRLQTMTLSLSSFLLHLTSSWSANPVIYTFKICLESDLPAITSIQATIIFIVWGCNHFQACPLIFLYSPHATFFALHIRQCYLLTKFLSTSSRPYIIYIQTIFLISVSVTLVFMPFLQHTKHVIDLA